MTANDQQQSWSLNGDVEEIQLYETQYAVSEWDQNLDLLLDELQESVSSPQKTKGRNQITSLPSIPASERQSKIPSTNNTVLTSSQFLELAEEALRQTAIARRLLESIADEPTTTPSDPASSNTIASSQSSEKELTAESENNIPSTSVSERAKAWTTRGVQTVQPAASTPPRKVSLIDGKKISTETSPTAEGLRSFKLHPATVEDIETALNNLKIATDSKKILTYTEHMEYTQVPSNSEITESVMSEEKSAEFIAPDIESPPKYNFDRKFSADSLKILEFTEFLSSKKTNTEAESDEGLLVAPSNITDNQKTLENKVKSKTSPLDIDEWATKLAQLDTALNLLMEGLDNN
uniref:Uncharacterized protein n=1 Tax=Daphnia galeata TaxID=27404 RepID=A0A8J2RHN2_9CRUS|nr:unnamed protein product [Daphnia galeata]